MTKKEERRRHQRTFCSDTWTEVRIVTPLTSESTGKATIPIKVKIDNISVSEACIISEKPFELDQLLQFQDGPQQKQGRVVWTCQSKIECKAGIQFE